ncbi:threonine--tRNA ligase [Candidatus Dojkabacteria bacterium]|nr:threonine--tRNA ligase [Candidatus Dojkabacteria bacterium]
MKDKFEDFKESLPDYVNEENFNLYCMRHSAEHVLTQAMQNIYGKDKIVMAMGPATEEGYYFDFDSPEGFSVSEEDFEKIEEEMRKIIKANQKIERREIPLDRARTHFAENKYKQEWLDEIEERGDKEVTIYVNIDKDGKEVFVDLCKGPHVGYTKQVGKVKLLSVAGAYWRGDEKNKMLTRIYGTAFKTQKELDDYLWRIEEAKKRDHRKLGKELDLFTFSDLVGAGLPMFTTRGTILRDLLNDYSQGLREEIGFERIWTPHITKTDLYKTSGHWDKFGDELFLVKSQETNDQMVLKPMNCPHHTQIYASKMRSYKELPLKMMETTTDYRDEKTGELTGLSRVRSLTQDDSHSFCTPEQIEEVYQELIQITSRFFDSLGMRYKVRLSYWDPDEPEKYLGDPELWKKSQGILLEIAKRNNLDYYEAEGEAAFYGPKMDFMVKDALGREHQLATPQLDFNMPGRFGLSYVDSDGKEKTPVMIHYALMGSIERFLSVYIEHTAGKFPAWLAPEQVAIIPIGEDNHEYADKVEVKLKEEGIRVLNDKRDDMMQAKIRDAQKMQIPYMLVLGKREEEEGKVSVRYRDEKKNVVMKLDEFAHKLEDKIENRDLELEL